MIASLVSLSPPPHLLASSPVAASPAATASARTRGNEEEEGRSDKDKETSGRRRGREGAIEGNKFMAIGQANSQTQQQHSDCTPAHLFVSCVLAGKVKREAQSESGREKEPDSASERKMLGQMFPLDNGFQRFPGKRIA